MGIIPNLKLSLKEFVKYDLNEVLIMVAAVEIIPLTMILLVL